MGGRPRAASFVSGHAMRYVLKTLGRDLAMGLVLAMGIATAAAAPPSVHALEGARYFFRAKDGTILTLLMLDFLAAREGPTYVGAASVEETDRRGEALPGASAQTVSLEMGSGPAMQGKATFFGRVYLLSGRSYLVRYVVKNETDDEIFLKNALVVVPYLNGGFSASSVVPAEQFGPANSDAGPFQVGSEEVVPKAGGIFRRSELLRLYLQVYDATVDSSTSQSRVDVAFRFYRQVKGSSKRQGKPYWVRRAAGASMGLALPIGDWPTGSYRVVVELHDRLTSALTSTEGSFSIVED
jgi:hypothetical protein